MQAWELERELGKVQDKLNEIHDISNKIWDWLCDRPPMLGLYPAIEKIRELSQPSGEKTQ